MIEPLSSPGMGMDIRLSTLEPVQQLGARLAQVLSSELSRLRADAAFALASGVAAHAPAAQHDTLRAQQSSVLGKTMVGLTSRPTSFGPNADSVIRDAEMSRRKRAVGQPVEERIQQEKDQEHTQDEVYSQERYQEHHKDLRSDNESDGISDNAILAAALSAALDQCRQLSNDIGLSGAPVAVALPAKYWVDNCAPADMRYRSELAANVAESDDTGDLLVLCLAFDGSLGHSRVVFGLLFIADNWVGSLHTQWSREGPAVSATPNTCSVSVVNSATRFSVVNASCDSGCCVGIRVKLDELTDEPELWFWGSDRWTWH